MGLSHMKRRSSSLLIIPCSPIRQTQSQSLGTSCGVQRGGATGSPHTPSLEDEKTHPQGEYLGQSIQAEHAHVPSKPADSGNVSYRAALTHVPQDVFSRSPTEARLETINIPQQGTALGIMACPYPGTDAAGKGRWQSFVGQSGRFLRTL